MRGIVVVLATLAACELQPPPKQKPVPTPPPPAPAPVVPKVAPAEAPVPVPPKVEPTQPCLDTSVRVVEVLIAAASDPAQRSVYEQERTRMVRATAEACTTQQWSADAMGCYRAAKTPADIKACEQKFPPPRAQPPPGVQPPPARAAPPSPPPRQPPPPATKPGR